MGRAGSIFTITAMSIPAPPSIYQLMEGVSFLEEGSGSFAAICPFSRLSSVPSGLCSEAWRHGAGEGLECRCKGVRVEEQGGAEEGKSLLRASGLDWRSEELRHFTLLSM